MAYKSKGTVRVESIIGDWKLFFVPDNNYSVKNGNRDCAVFLNTRDSSFDRGRIVDLDENGRGVKVTLGKDFQKNSPAIRLLSSAVTGQIKVEITGNINGRNRTVELTDIALPVK